MKKIRYMVVGVIFALLVLVAIFRYISQQGGTVVIQDMSNQDAVTGQNEQEPGSAVQEPVTVKELTNISNRFSLPSKEVQSDALRATVPSEAVLMIDVLDFTVLEDTLDNQKPPQLPLYGVVYFLPHEDGVYTVMLARPEDEEHKVLFLTAEEVYEVYKQYNEGEHTSNPFTEGGSYWSYIGDDVIVGRFTTYNPNGMMEGFVISVDEQKFIYFNQSWLGQPISSWYMLVDNSFRYNHLELSYSEGMRFLYEEGSSDQSIVQVIRTSIADEEFDIFDVDNDPDAKRALENTVSLLLSQCDSAYLKYDVISPLDSLDHYEPGSKQRIYDYPHIQKNIASWRENAKSVLQDPAVYCDASIEESGEEKIYRIDLETHEVTEVSLPE